MALKLVVTTNVNGDVFELVLKKSKYRVGRRHDNDLRIKETYISGFHSELNRNADGDYELSDCGSSNGTFLNGRRVEGSAVVKEGDFIKFGILKVAVKEHEESGPKIVSLKDRAAFAKKRNEMTAAIAVAGNTGSIASPNVISGPSDATAAQSPSISSKEMEDLQSLLDEKTRKAADLADQLKEEKANREKLAAEIAGLRKEASEAARLAPLETQLKESLAEISTLNSDLESLRKQLAEKENSITSEKSIREETEREKSEGAAKVKSLEASLKSLEKESAELRSQLDKAKKESESVKTEASSAQSDANTLRKEIAELKASAEATAKELSGAEKQRTADLRAKESKISELKAEVDSLRKGLSGKESALQETAKEAAKLAVLVKTVDSLKEELSISQSFSSALEKDKASIEKLTRSKDEELSTLKANLADREKKIADLSKDSEELLALKEELSVSQSFSSALEKDKANIEKLILAKDEELSTLKASLANQEKQIADLSRDSEELRALKGDLEAIESKIEKASQGALAEREQFRKELAARDEANRKLEEQLQQAQEELGKEKKALADEVAELSKEKTRLASSLEENESLIAKQKEELIAFKADLQSKETELTQLSSDAKRAGELSSEVESLKAELSASRASLAELSSGEKATRAQIETQTAELDSLRKSLEKEIGERESLEEKLREESRSLETTAKEKKQLESELEKVKAEAAKAAQEEITRLEARIAESESELANQAVSAEKSAGELASALAAIAAVTAAKDALESEVSAYRESGSSATREAATAKEELINSNAELAKTRTQLKQQTDALQDAKAEANRLRVDLQKSREEAATNYSATEKELSSRIADLETALASEKVRAGDAKSKNDALKAEIEKLTDHSKNTSGEADQLRKRIEEVSKNNGQLQAQLNKESAEANQLREQLESSQTTLSSLRAQIDTLEKTVLRKEHELEEKDQEHARNESDAIVQIKRELGEAEAARKEAEENATQLQRDKASLNSAFERLKEQLAALEAEHAEAKTREETFNHDKGVLARRLEKAESSNNELAARIKEDAAAAIANRDLIQKLEAQLQANESEAVRIERERSSSLKTEISKLERINRDQGQNVELLNQRIADFTSEKSKAEESILQLNERIVALESEEASMKKLLQEAEKKRADLSDALAEQTELATQREATIQEQKQELADTISKFRSAETSLLEKHRGELEQLHNELRTERKQSSQLEAELENTRVGLSDALRSARDQAEQDRSKILADGNAKLSKVEDELSLAISARENIELSRNALEDELNERDERIERLVEHVEDLELKIRDEKEARERDLSELEKTKEGFSGALSANWKHLAAARASFDSEKTIREKAETEILEAKAEIARLEDEADKARKKFEAELNDWEERFDQLREEKLTLASEDANLKRIRDQIIEAQAEKKLIESQLSKLNSGMKNFQSQHQDLETQKEALLSEREKLKAGLNAARMELESVQRRCSESQNQEQKLAETIDSAERRIQSLKKLEAQMEQAVERKRQSGLLSRSDVFSQESAPSGSGSADFSEEEFYRKLITKLDLIDDLSKRYDNRWRYPKVSDQLSLLKNSFLDFLHDHSVREFHLEPGTVLSVEERKRIKLVPPDQANGRKGLPVAAGQNGNSSRVVETVRPGYIYQNGSVDIVIRKAEVIVG